MSVLEELLKFSPIPMEPEQAKFLIAKGLGYSIIVASSLIKLPQLFKITGARNSAGINFYGQALELFAYSLNCGYSFAKDYPFSAWGESLFLLVENFLICLAVLFYNNQKLSCLIFSFLYTLSFGGLMSGLIPIDILWYLQSLNLPLAIGGKMIQGISNYRNGHTGQCSAITATCLFLGCIARIFTTIQETKDNLMIVNFTVASMANFILVSQIFYYWENTNKFLAKSAKKKKK
ncbi:mannose-P-dolichol utilization defect 1 protein homolog [Panonychus citri]|uniref:mannose-P-dolichol utilization defect 1 protein homolog n=1 Tax=Panonychus citri TaxID=50023 RepID=UPI00230737BE|nr:mannose-P-dolichol utilization defect 1 protein homolog [Panonychus citri]